VGRDAKRSREQFREAFIESAKNNAFFFTPLQFYSFTDVFFDASFCPEKSKEKEVIIYIYIIKLFCS
jgi:hypothetical protein